jgi:hypothetical protein
MQHQGWKNTANRRVCRPFGAPAPWPGAFVVSSNSSGFVAAGGKHVFLLTRAFHTAAIKSCNVHAPALPRASSTTGAPHATPAHAQRVPARASSPDSLVSPATVPGSLSCWPFDRDDQNRTAADGESGDQGEISVYSKDTCDGGIWASRPRSLPEPTPTCKSPPLQHLSGGDHQGTCGGPWPVPNPSIHNTQRPLQIFQKSSWRTCFQTETSCAGRHCCARGLFTQTLTVQRTMPQDFSPLRFVP